MTDNDERLLEPAESYKSYYKQEFIKNAEELFASLESESGINADENRKTANEYREKQKIADSIAKSKKKWTGLRVFLIILAIVSGIAFFIGLSQGSVPISVVSIVLLVGSLLFIFLKVNKVINSLSERHKKAQDEADRVLSVAQEQMRPLLALFDSSMTHQLITKTVPKLDIDRRFDMRRFDYLHGKYGLSEEIGENNSTIGLMSGEILGNPFLVEKQLCHRLGKKTYSGSVTIHWTTYERNSEGKSVPRQHTEVLTAYVTKPCPYYGTNVHLIYGNDAAPDLSFSHEKTHAEKMSEAKLKSYIKSGEKKIRKMAAKNVTSGFTEMSNVEFDVLFNGTERDNESQFRMLFTPLAQKNMLDLMKGKSPYGDDFYFRKNKCLNYITSEHSQTWSDETGTFRYASYDIDICRTKFLDFNLNYFTGFYFDMAPLLAIPLYQQNMPREYIYGEKYDRLYTVREVENLANKIGASHFANSNTGTQTILKTVLERSEGETDYLSVTASSYRTEPRVSYITKLGGDGHTHEVPVHWIEYIPVFKRSTMSIRKLDVSDAEYRNSVNINEPHSYSHGLLAVIGELFDDTEGKPLDDEDGENETIDLENLDKDIEKKLQETDGLDGESDSDGSQTSDANQESDDD